MHACPTARPRRTKQKSQRVCAGFFLQALPGTPLGPAARTGLPVDQAVAVARTELNVALGRITALTFAGSAK